MRSTAHKLNKYEPWNTSRNAICGFQNKNLRAKLALCLSLCVCSARVCRHDRQTKSPRMKSNVSNMMACEFHWLISSLIFITNRKLKILWEREKTHTIIIELNFELRKLWDGEKCIRCWNMNSRDNYRMFRTLDNAKVLSQLAGIMSQRF